MHEVEWDSTTDVSSQLGALCALARRPAVVVVKFPGAATGTAPAWAELEAWTRSRAVTVADVTGPIASPELDIALCSDLVYLRTCAALVMPPAHDPLTAGLLWSLGRAGRAAVAHCLLDSRTLAPDEAVRLGLAHAVAAADVSLPLPRPHSLAALVAVRDLARARASGRGALQLELANFRFLFATGDPEEGARAFLEGRNPRFEE